jgi:hypothetical protein
MLGFTPTMLVSSDDATQVLPRLTDDAEQVSEATLLEDAYRRAMGGNDEALQQDVRGRINQASQGIEKRSKARGASLTATLVFAGLLVGAQVAIVIANFSGYQKFATKPTILGLLVILWGMLPTSGNLVPHHRGDEGVEAIGNTPLDWLCELVSRSSSQRQQLWRLRLALVISLPLTAMTFILLLFV